MCETHTHVQMIKIRQQILIFIKDFHLYLICDVIKQNELDVANIDFEL